MYTFTSIFLLKYRMCLSSYQRLLCMPAPLWCSCSFSLSLSRAIGQSGTTGSHPLAYKNVLLFLIDPASPSSCQPFSLLLLMTKIGKGIFYIHASTLCPLASALISPWSYSCQDQGHSPQSQIHGMLLWASSLTSDQYLEFATLLSPGSLPLTLLAGGAEESFFATSSSSPTLKMLDVLQVKPWALFSCYSAI